MIPPNELRIGNWVMSKQGIPIQVLAYFDKSIRNEIYTTSNTDLKYEEDDCDGIPLSSGIFKRMDVADAGGGWFIFGNENLVFSFEHQGFVDAARCRLHDYPMLFIHQFQNWYYTKTGKELEISL